MFERAVCPDCFDGFHSGCTGNGCFCDCQLEDAAEALDAEDDDEDIGGCEFGHDDLDECDDCGGCRECGDCFCEQEDEDDDDE